MKITIERLSEILYSDLLKMFNEYSKEEIDFIYEHINIAEFAMDALQDTKDNKGE